MSVTRSRDGLGGYGQRGAGARDRVSRRGHRASA